MKYQPRIGKKNRWSFPKVWSRGIVQQDMHFYEIEKSYKEK
jgi:hypothetical protein